jgi:hypothetical protein
MKALTKQSGSKTQKAPISNKTHRILARTLIFAIWFLVFEILVLEILGLAT